MYLFVLILSEFWLIIRSDAVEKIIHQFAFYFRAGLPYILVGDVNKQMHPFFSIHVCLNHICEERENVC